MKTMGLSPLGLCLVGATVLAAGTTTAADRYARSGILEVEKECTGFTGAPGSFCTITSANIPGVPVGARIYYSQPEGIPGLGLDTNVVLEAANGNRAFGRCTLDTSLQGLCTFSDGIGDLAGFTARVYVTTTDYVNWQWVGTYQFEEVGIVWPRN